MIVLQNGEKLRRRLPGKLKKFGKGTFYITNQRICFEHEKHGLCFDLGLNHLCHWRIRGKRTIQFKWQEHTPHQVEAFDKWPVNFEPEFDCEIEFDRKNFAGIEIKAEHVAMALYLAYINYWPYGMRTMGYWADTQGRLWNLFFADGKEEPITGGDDSMRFEAKDLEIRGGQIQMLHDLGCSKNGCKDCIMLYQSKEELIPDEGNPGETLLEQELYENLMTIAYEERNMLRDRTGRPDPEHSYGIDMMREDMRNMAAGYDVSQKRFEDEIKKYESEGNTTELQKVTPASKASLKISWPFPEGTIYDTAKHNKKLGKIFQRAAIVMDEIMENDPDAFETPGGFDGHHSKVLRAISNHLKAGNDISNYTPEPKIEKRVYEHYLTDIPEYRKRLTETV